MSDARVPMLMEIVGCDEKTAVAWLNFYDTYKPTAVELQRLLCHTAEDIGGDDDE